MLQTMRNNLQGVVAYFIVGIIIIVFALFGVEALIQGKTSRNAIASVNGKDITEIDLRRGMEGRKQQLAAMFGGKVDPQFLRDEFLRDPVLQGLIQRRLFESAVEDNDLHVDNKAIDKKIVTDKNFQKQGKFDAKYYAQLLARYGYTPTSYREELKQEYLLTQFQNTFVQSSFVTDKEVEALAKLQFEKRSFEFATLPIASVLPTVMGSDDEIAAYYDKHKTDFLSDEQVSVEYLELRKEDLLADVKITDDDILNQYNAEVKAAKDKVTRHAAHILIEEEPDGSQQATLNEIQQRLAKGEDFAALAKQYSVDAGSAQQGGDVGETTGTNFVPEFEDALKKLAVGQVSAPVKTQFGYHIIKLLGQKEAKVDTLAASKQRIESDLKQQQADELYAEKLDALRDASQSAASLSDIALQLSPSHRIMVQHREAVSKQAAMMMFRNKSVVDALFTDTLQAGMSTDVLELDKTHAIVLHLTDRKPAEVKSLDQVKPQIADIVRKEKAGELLKAKAAALQARLAAGENFEKLAKAEHLDWKVAQEKSRDDSSLPADVVKKIFTMPKPLGAAPSLEVLTLTSGDVVLLELKSVQSPTAEQLTAEQKAKTHEQLQSKTANHEFMALAAMLQANAKVVQKQKSSSDALN